MYFFLLLFTTLNNHIITLYINRITLCIIYAFVKMSSVHGFVSL